MDLEKLDPQLVLKTTPPRFSDALIPRSRLTLDHLGLSHKPAICVQAPAGFGKTSLLMQWRRSAQAAGAVVVWFSADHSDDAMRFAIAIGYALTRATALRGSEPRFLRWLRDQVSGVAALTGLLAELAEQPFDVVLLVDNVERARSVLHEALGYLIRNAPNNLQIVVSMRSGTTLDVPEIADPNIVARISSEDLAFSYDETIAAISRHFGDKINAEEAGRLHEQTDGWPLGLQLSIATLRKSPDVHAAIRAISASTGDVHRYFVENLLTKLAPDLSDFLTRISIFEVVHPDLCETVFSTRNAVDLLARLERETPVFLHAEGSPWMRMHGLARDFLLRRFAVLPPEDQHTISERACLWLSDHGLYEEAARHALLAGQEEFAYALAERTLYQIGYRGDVSRVLDWIDRLPPADIQRRPALWTAAAWSLALTNRRQEAERIVRYIVTAHADDPRQQFEAALISAVAASFDDQTERFQQLIDPATVQPPPMLHEKTERIYTNVLGFFSFQNYELGKARHFWAQNAQKRSPDPADYSSGFAEFGIGLTHLWEGQFRTAEQYLRPALTRSELALGRRNPVCCMMAAVLAAALWEMGGSDEPQSVLSYRLDVLEKAGLPEAIMLAYKTLSRLAMEAGNEPHAHEYLDAMLVLGETRGMPRLKIASVCEQIRLHARADRQEAVARLHRKLAAMCGELGLDNSSVMSQWVRLHRSRALAYQALMLRDWSEAIEHLAVSGACAERMGLARDSVEIQLLRAVALKSSSKEDVSSLLKESLSLARASGMVRTLLDTHPYATHALKEVSNESEFRVNDLLHALHEPFPSRASTRVESVSVSGAAYANALLTSKEKEILGLIANNMTNKQIAVVLDISAGTVKWHVKNIFAKLDAGTRAHAVKRAHLLGILGPNR